MKIFRQINEIPNFKNGVLTIGTFDGVHMGHQSIIQRINNLAKKIDGESIILTFHPHPRSIISKKRVELISPLGEKFALLKKYKVDNVVVIPFTRSFSEQSPEDYVKGFLYQNFKPHTIVIGYDHRFGKDRAGDINFLKTKGNELGFGVEEISKQLIDDLAISSTKIREALTIGKVSVANELLGHPYYIKGIVVRGQQLGRQIGFPTANINIQEPDKLVPANGVYAVRAYLKDQGYNGMLNIGFRPTVEGIDKTIEVNIFDFEANIYGEEIKVELIKHIRPEEKFAGLSELVEQLEKDREKVKAILK